MKWFIRSSSFAKTYKFLNNQWTQFSYFVNLHCFNLPIWSSKEVCITWFYARLLLYLELKIWINLSSTSWVHFNIQTACRKVTILNWRNIFTSKIAKMSISLSSTTNNLLSKLNLCSYKSSINPTVQCKSQNI